MARVLGDGARIAQLFRHQRQLENIRACDLERLAHDDGLEICDFTCAEPGCTAVLLRTPGDSAGGIMLAPGQRLGRRRFSIGHEFGHYHMPRHADRGRFSCTEVDMRTRATDSQLLEWEANDFAAELLMPHKLFAADVSNRDVSFESAYWLAAEDMYAVSATAAAWRLIQLSRDRCALVMAVGGRVTWVARSVSFGLPLIEKSQILSSDSLAGAARRGEGSTQKPKRVPWHAWFDGTQTDNGELLESTHEVPSLDQVLSLLWFIEGDADEED